MTRRAHIIDAKNPNGVLLTKSQNGVWGAYRYKTPLMLYSIKSPDGLEHTLKAHNRVITHAVLQNHHLIGWRVLHWVKDKATAVSKAVGTPTKIVKVKATAL